MPEAPILDEKGHAHHRLLAERAGQGGQLEPVHQAGQVVGPSVTPSDLAPLLLAPCRGQLE